MLNDNLTKTFKFSISVICLCTALVFTTTKVHATGSDPFIGEIMCGGWNFCPAGWMECNGALLPISEYDTLFNLIGTTYGGDGQETFAIPDLQGRTMLGQGQGSGLSNRVMGETGGVETVTLTAAQIPSHSHTLNAHNGTEKSASPTGNIPGKMPDGTGAYSTSVPNKSMAGSVISPSGASQPHENRQPYLVNKCCISLFGIFPSPT